MNGHEQTIIQKYNTKFCRKATETTQNRRREHNFERQIRPQRNKSKHKDAKNSLEEGDEKVKRKLTRSETEFTGEKLSQARENLCHHPSQGGPKTMVRKYRRMEHISYPFIENELK